MKEYSFKGLERQILDALKKLDEAKFFGDGNPTLNVMDGFGYLPIQDAVGGRFDLGKRTLPIVIVINNATGQIWQFSLKQLVPSVELQ